MSNKGTAQAIFVSTTGDALHTAFGYALTLSQRIAATTKDTLLFAVRLNDPFSGEERLDQDINRIFEAASSSSHFGRSESRPFSTLVVAVERADVAAEGVLDAIHAAVQSGIDVVFVASVDTAQRPDPQLISSFDNARIVNLPGATGDHVRIGDIKIPGDA